MTHFLTFSDYYDRVENIPLEWRNPKYPDRIIDEKSQAALMLAGEIISTCDFFEGKNPLGLLQNFIYFYEKNRYLSIRQFVTIIKIKSRAEKMLHQARKNGQQLNQRFPSYFAINQYLNELDKLPTSRFYPKTEISQPERSILEKRFEGLYPKARFSR